MVVVVGGLIGRLIRGKALPKGLTESGYYIDSDKYDDGASERYKGRGMERERRRQTDNNYYVDVTAKTTKRVMDTCDSIEI